ncbi:MAG: hypothetical protein J6N76_04635 [Lachnospiraceae bacterium]|nr:hypothetical protein [Lachnospiraceae bacterium]
MTEATTQREEMVAEYKNLTEEMRTSKKGGFLGRFRSNSPEFGKVLDSMADSYALIEEKMPKTMAEVRLKGAELIEQLNKTLTACNTYINKAGGKSSNGAVRMNLVKKAYLTVLNDMTALSDSLKLITGDEPMQKGVTWTTLMRTRQINAYTDFKELKHYGAAISDLVELTKKEDPLGGGFFKESDVIEIKYEEELFKECKQKALEQMEKDGYKLTKELKKIIKDLPDMDSYDKVNEDPVFDIALEYIKKIYDPRMLEMDYATLMGMKEKMQPNGKKGIVLADRDVATYRIAALFGKASLVAKSEKVSVKTWDHNYNGHLMQKAEGQEATQFVADMIKEKVKAGKGDTIRNSDLQEKLTGGFIRDLSNVHILDYICGQIDRHLGNYFVQKDANGKLIGLKCIDNNMAFGGKQNYEKKMITNLSSPVSTDGELVLQFMDMEMANTILAMRPELVRLQLAGFIEPEEIDQVIQRISNLQMAIKRELDNGNEAMFLTSEEQWMEHQDECKMTKDGEMTYLAQLLASGQGKEAYEKDVIRQKGEKWLEENKNTPYEELIGKLETLLGSGRMKNMVRKLNFLNPPQENLPKEFDITKFYPIQHIFNRKVLGMERVKINNKTTYRVIENTITPLQQKIIDQLKDEIGAKVTQ